jgi:FkbM family methyltransferase
MSALSVGKGLLQSFAARYNYQIERKYDFGKYRLDVLELLVEQSKPDDPDFFFLQIGAHDGQTLDPINQMIRRYGWRGILLEPQPDVFRQLTENYRGNDRLIFENAALAISDGQMPFWTIPGQTILGSLDKQVLYRSGFKDNQISEAKVAAISAATLLAKHHVSRVDLLQADTEGFDFEVIKMILAAQIRPKIINYEHINLSTADRDACVNLLGGLGYKLLRSGAYGLDTVAFLSMS